MHACVPARTRTAWPVEDFLLIAAWSPLWVPISEPPVFLFRNYPSRPLYSGRPRPPTAPLPLPLSYSFADIWPLKHIEMSGTLFRELVLPCSLGASTHSKDGYYGTERQSDSVSYQLLRPSSICWNVHCEVSHKMLISTSVQIQRTTHSLSVYIPLS